LSLLLPVHTDPFDSDLRNTTPVIVTPTDIVQPETIPTLPTVNLSLKLPSVY